MGTSVFLFCFFFFFFFFPSPFLSTAEPDVTLSTDMQEVLAGIFLPGITHSIYCLLPFRWSPSLQRWESWGSFPPIPWSVVSVVFWVLESLSPLRSPKPDLVGDHTRVSLDERGMYGMFFNEQFMKFLFYMFRKFFKLKSTNISPRKLEFAAAQMQALVFKNILY